MIPFKHAARSARNPAWSGLSASIRSASGLPRRGALLVGLWGLSLLPASALVIGVDFFDYADGPLANRNGGQLWNWRNRLPTARAFNPSDWDNFSGSAAVRSGRLITDDSSISREYNGPGEDPPASTDEGHGAINGLSTFQEKNVFYRVTFTTGSRIPSSLGINSSDFGTTTAFFGKASNSPFLGINSSGGQTLSSTALMPNTTYTLVTWMDYTAGFARLYINPVISDVPPPTPSVSRAIPTNWSTAVRLSSIGTGSGGDAVVWDDLVVCTLWSDLDTITVTTLVDEDNGTLSAATGAGASLREAVKYAPPGRRITFSPSLSGKVIRLSLGQILVPAAVTIDATALSGGLTVDGDHSSRHFQVDAGNSLTLRGLTLTRGNGSGGGGGSILSTGSLILDRCSLVENTCPGDGGAVNGKKLVRAVSSTFFDNTAGGNGGAFLVSEIGSRLELQASTLSGNTATGPGGIDLLQLTSCELSASTVSGNSSSGGAPGGLRLNLAGAQLKHSTISQNTGTGGGGGLGLLPGSNITIENTIIAGNADTGGGPADLSSNSSTVTPSGANLIGSNQTVEGIFPAGRPNAGGSYAGTAGTPLDPRLTPPGYFGGPVMTMHPLIGSPAIDAGTTANPGGSDARGFPRLTSGNGSATARLDIGAVEAGELRRLQLASDISALTLRQLLNENSSDVAYRIAFSPAVFPASPIELTFDQLDLLPGTTFFLDASDLSGPVTISARNASRVFRIQAGSSLAMHSVKIINGRAPDSTGSLPEGDGGGILNAGSLSLFSSTIAGNRCGDATNFGAASRRGGNGGGICSSGPLSLHACTVSGNQAGDGASIFDSAGGNGGSGGGICSSGPLKITACTVAHNLAGNAGQGRPNGAGGDGGAIKNLGSASCRITQSTLVENSAPGTGGFSEGVSGGILVLENSLVVKSKGAVSSRDIRVSNYRFVGKNILTIDPLRTTFSGSTGPAALLTGDPGLAPLGDYGGPTLTLLPLPGSPAITAATTGSTRFDQRGVPLAATRHLGAVQTPDGFVDKDGDGMDDRLEPLYGFRPGVDDGSLDADGDGSSNRDELGSKTNPRDPNSLLKILTFTREGVNVGLTWASFPGLEYSFEYGSTLDFGGSLDLGTATTLTQSTLVGPFNGPATFVRIRRK